MKNQTKRKFKENDEPSITDLMKMNDESRETTLEKLGLTAPKRVKSVFDRNTRSEIKSAKKADKEAFGAESLIPYFMRGKMPSFGSFSVNQMKVKTM